jgi:hypothetical protein
MPLSRYDISKNAIIIDRRSGGAILLIPAQITGMSTITRSPRYDHKSDVEAFLITPVGGEERLITDADEVMLASEIRELAAVLFPVEETVPVIVAPGAPAGDAVVPS